jgi:hypothetical protein
VDSSNTNGPVSTKPGQLQHAIRLTLAVTILAALYLPACSGEPKIKADTESNFTSSFAEVINGMSTEDKQKLDAALKDIVLVQVGLALSG